MEADQSGAVRGCGSTDSMRAMSCSARNIRCSNFSFILAPSAYPQSASSYQIKSKSRAVVRVDGHVLVAQVASPHRILRIATAQQHAHGDLALLHHALAILLVVLGVAPALRGHVHIVEVEIDAGLIEVVNACV